MRAIAVSRAFGPDSRSALNCDKCRGKGKVLKLIKVLIWSYEAVVTCQTCRGTGRHQYRKER